MRQVEFLKMVENEAIDYIVTTKKALLAADIKSDDIFQRFNSDKEVLEDFLLQAVLKRGLI